MKPTYCLSLAVLLTALAHSTMMPVGAQTTSHAKFVENIRKAVKNPTTDHELYNLVIQPEFAQAVRDAAKIGNDTLVMDRLVVSRHGGGSGSNRLAL